MSSMREASTGEGAGGLMNLVSTVRNSVTLLIASFGVVLFVLGFIINQGIWAAIYAVWGTALALFGVTAYTFIWWQRR